MIFPKFDFTLTTYDDIEDAVTSITNARFADGTFKFSYRTYIDSLQEEAALCAKNATVVAFASNDNASTELQQGPGFLAVVTRYGTRSAKVNVCAVSKELAKEVFEEITFESRRQSEEDDYSTIDFGFWHAGNKGAQMRFRSIEVNPWPSIRQNYTSVSAGSLDAVMKLTPETINGRIIVLYGPAGTGKTSAIRTLAHEWRSWCRPEAVLDPEYLIGNTDYLLDVAQGDDSAKKWRMLVMEDFGEGLGSRTRSNSSGISRFLNVTDGLLGQGLRMIFVITTNLNLDDIHPALIRAGRCLAKIEVGLLTKAEATLILEDKALELGCQIKGSHISLADVYALRGDGKVIGEPIERSSTGMYL